MNRIALAAALLIVGVGTSARAADWTMNPATSELGFSATFEGSPAPGVFRTFTAAVRFDPDRLAESRIDVTIAVPSADMSSDDINKAIRGPDWFDVDRFPTAEFHSTQVRGSGANAYVIVGTLTVKGIAKPIEVPFHWQGEGDTATMSGEVAIDRATFKIGLGEWQSTKVIGAEVKVRFLLHLRKSG
jgi:polyisoprenoid-binding protein YceI